MRLSHVRQRAQDWGWDEFASWLRNNEHDDPAVVWRQVPVWSWHCFWLDAAWTTSRKRVPARLRGVLGEILGHAAGRVEPGMPTLASGAAIFSESKEWVTTGGHAEARSLLVKRAQDYERRADLVGRRPDRTSADQRHAELWWGASCWLQACYEPTPGELLAFGACHVDDSGLKPDSRVAFREMVLKACPKPPGYEQAASEEAA